MSISFVPLVCTLAFTVSLSDTYQWAHAESIEQMHFGCAPLERYVKSFQHGIKFYHVDALRVLHWTHSRTHL